MQLELLENLKLTEEKLDQAMQENNSIADQYEHKMVFLKEKIQEMI